MADTVLVDDHHIAEDSPGDPQIPPNFVSHENQLEELLDDLQQGAPRIILQE
jgi:hypothetical protein